MQREPVGAPVIRLAELMATLSLATDLGMGQPLEHALRSCVLAIRLGEALSLDEAELRAIYYVALLHHIGCTVDTYRMAALFGDELTVRAEAATVDTTDTFQAIGMLARTIRQTQAGTSPFHLAGQLAQGILTSAGLMKEEYAGFCEVATRLAARLGFAEPILQALRQTFERWDGKGAPAGLKGEENSRAARIVNLAQDIITFARLDGVNAAVAIARERRGAAYDPRIVDCFCQRATQLLSGLEEEPSWERVLALEPGAPVSLAEAQFDTACLAIADFADLKSPYLLGHSRGVADLSAMAARQCGLPAEDATTLRRAGWFHDLGRVGISAGIWGKPGPLTEREWERVRLHPYYTERLLARPATLARLGALAARHHERLDGSGYFHNLTASALSPAARLLAAADTYQAMTEPRPHRAALTAEAAAVELRREVRAGRLDGEAVNAVLAAAGHSVRRKRGELVAGLSPRELEVLRLVARGHSKKQIAALLTTAAKTVDNHIQHIYGKIGVSTRAGATLFAVEHDLLAGD